MAKMGNGYGSEFHLLRYLGRHREDLNRRLLAEIGGDSIEWLDFNFDKKSKSLDAELQGLDFIEPLSAVHDLWREFWPQGRGIQTWDAVGRIVRDGRPEWLLVEAKAHVAESRTDCAAKGKGSAHIRRALEEVKTYLGVPQERDWLRGCYQAANRIATLHFLQKHQLPARLVFLYFTGDRSGIRRQCPTDADGWREELRNLDGRLGLPPDHPLKGRIHKLFVPVKRLD
jgi:hypothetical protein